MDKNRLYYQLNIIFILLLLLPAAGFLYFGFKYQYLQDRAIKLFSFIALIYIFAGFHLLRKIFDNIIQLSTSVKEKLEKELAPGMVDENQGELQQIVQSFNTLESKLRASTELLSKRTSEVSVLKELSDICYVTLDPWEILYVTLERAMLLARADKGSVLILDRSDNKSFVVKASIGLGDFIKMDDRIDFETSIAKYAVINKGPLVVQDIEKEQRFGRTNRLHYGTKSFVIMPIKTIKDVIGVLTLSRDEGPDITETDVEVLTPLLSNAAFTYENLRLISEVELGFKQMASMKKVFKTLNSSLSNGELLHAIMDEIQVVLPFKVAVVMRLDEKRENTLTVIDVVADEVLAVMPGDHISLEGSIIDSVMQQENIKIIDDIDTVRNQLDERLQIPEVQSCMLAPITIRGKVNGIVIFYSKSSENYHKNYNIIECVTHILSFAIEESRLIASVTKRNQELITIKQIGSALASSTFDMQKVLEYTMTMIRTLMNVEAGALAFVKGNKLEFAVAFEIDLKKLAQVELVLGQGISGAVASRGEPIIENDVPNSSNFYLQIDNITGFTTRSVLCVPMISQGKVIGTLEVMNKREGDFSEDDRDILQSIATSVSIGLENARLYKETVAMADQERSIRSMFQKFVPREIVDKIDHEFSVGKTVVDEFKTVTLLNIDIRGFSKIARGTGPQKSVALLNYFFSIMGGIVFKHNGIVDKYLGDGFLALFGAPASTSGDAQNALSAALEMQKAIQNINRDCARGLVDKPFHVGISIYTGDVVVGNIGFEMKMDYTVIGDTVNNVFRLQELTKPIPDCIMIADSTARATQTSLDLKDVSTAIADMKVYQFLGFKKNGAEA